MIRAMCGRRTCGFTLVELMIAIVISTTVIAAALSFYARMRSDYRVNERVARMQEQGRMAMSVIEPDIELAGYYGFTNVAEVIQLVRGASPSVVVAAVSELRQFPVRAGDPLPVAVGSLPPGAHACGTNFAVDVSMPIQGANDGFVLGRSRSASCNPYQGRAQAGADTLTVRRATTRTSTAEANRIQLYADRTSSQARQLLFSDGVAPGPANANHQVQDFVVRSYYIAQDSVNQRGWPALRVKTLTRSGANAVFDDEEVMSGVEDLQVQFGIDTADHDDGGVIDPELDVDGDGVATPAGQATRYVNPDFTDLPRMQVVAVRVWLRVRSDEGEVGFRDTQTYRYANVVYTPTNADRSIRRALISRTVAVRNARVM